MHGGQIVAPQDKDNDDRDPGDSKAGPDGDGVVGVGLMQPSEDVFNILRMFFEGLIYPPVRPLRPAVRVVVAALVLEAGANLDAGVSQGGGGAREDEGHEDEDGQCPHDDEQGRPGGK